MIGSQPNLDCHRFAIRQSIDMAMKLAGFSLDEGRRVVMFFNVKGVEVPVTKLDDDLAFQQEQPFKTQLA